MWKRNNGYKTLLETQRYERFYWQSAGLLTCKNNLCKQHRQQYITLLLSVTTIPTPLAPPHHHFIGFSSIQYTSILCTLLYTLFFFLTSSIGFFSYTVNTETLRLSQVCYFVYYSFYKYYKIYKCEERYILFIYTCLLCTVFLPYDGNIKIY